MQELVQRLNGLSDEQPFQAGWYLKDVRTGAEADRSGDLIGPSASTRKFAILRSGSTWLTMQVGVSLVLLAIAIRAFDRRDVSV